MKKKIISFVSLLALVAGIAFAAFAKAPSLDGTYYLYNEETGLYMSRGAAWGTACTADYYGMPVNLEFTDMKSKIVFYDWQNTGLGADLFTDNGAPVAFTFAGDAETGYIIFAEGLVAGSGYVSVDAAGVQLKVEADAANASKWKMLTKEEYEQKIAAKYEAECIALTADTVGNKVVDLTEKIQNAALTATDGWTWTPGRNNSSIASNANGSECYKGSGVLAQTVEGLAPGLYKVSVQAFYRDGSNADCVTRANAGYKMVNAYLEANGYRVRMMDWASDRAGDANPDNMDQYKALADQGKYKVEVYTVVGADGKLDIKLNEPNYIDMGWWIFSNVTLTQYVVAGEQAADGTYYLYNPATGLYMSRGSFWGTACTADYYGMPVNLAFTEMDSKIVFYDWQDRGLGKDLYTDNGSPMVFTFAGDAETGYTIFAEGLDAGAGYVSVDAAGAQLKVEADAANASKWVLLTKESYEQKIAAKYAADCDLAYVQAAVDTVGCTLADLTEKIQNAALTATDGWTWTPGRNNSSIASNANGSECYQGTGALTQTVEGLAPGLYKVSIQAFYRDGTNADCVTRATAGYKMVNAYLEANGYRVRMMDWASDRAGDSNPNSMPDYKVLADQGKYKVEVYTVVGADGKLDIKLNEPNYIDIGWWIFSNVTLTQYVPAGKKADATVKAVFDPEHISIGETATMTIKSNSAGDITVTSVDPAIATVEGSGETWTITGVAPGVAQLKVVQTEDATHNAFEGIFELTITEYKDLTSKILNHSFEDALNNWNQDGASLKLASQGNSSFALKDGSKYVEYWQPNGTLHAEQTISDLHMGVYEVTVAALARGIKSASLFVNDVKVPMEIADKCADYKATIAIDEGDSITIGFDAEGTGAGNSWFAADNFRLYLMSASLPAVTKAEGKMNKAVSDAQDAAIKEYNDNPTVASYNAALAAIAAAEASIAIYKQIAELNAKVADLDESGQKAYAPIMEAYENGTIETYEEALEGFRIAVKSQTSIGSDWSLLGSNKKDDWAGASGTYQAGVELYTGDNTPAEAKKLMYQTIEGLMPGAKYEVKFYAAANVARNLSAENYGEGIAYVFAGATQQDITVGQLSGGSFETEEFLRTIVATVGEDGKLEFGLANKKVGGQWYFAQFVSLKLVEPGIPTCWDFTKLTPAKADGTGNLKNEIKDDGGAGWSNLQNNAAITDEELTTSEGVPYALTKGLKFTAGGSGWIHIRNYPEVYSDGKNYFGKQLFSNNKDLMMTVPVKAGQYVIFTALSASGALTLKAIEGIDTTAIALCGHDKYVYKSKAGDVKFNLAKNMTIKKIEVVDEMPEGLWNFETLVPIKAEDKGNLKNEIKDDGGVGWTNLQNKAAIEDEELTIDEGVPYNVTKGLKFTAGGSGWIHIRNYPEENGGQQFYSNNKDLKVRVPAVAGQYIVFDAFSASGTTQIVYGEDTVDVYPGSVSGYIVKATEDNPVINIKKQLTIKKIYVLDVAPYLLAANLKASVAATTVKVGDKSQITWTSYNATTPIFASSNEEVATVNAKGEISAIGAGEVTITATQPANAYFNEATATIALKVENAGPTELAAAITEAIAGKAYGDTATVTLDGKVAYTFEKPVDVGLVNLVINGNGAVVTLSDSVQIAGMQGIEINEVNFICDANTKLAPIALSANPDSVLIGAKYPVAEGATNNLRSKAFYNEGAIVINGCNFSGIHTSWISANKREWNLKTLKIVNTIAQFDVATGIDSYINWTGNSNNEGSIKDIVIEGSTLYNIVENNDNRFLRLQNNSNSQAQKAWAEPQFDAKESWVMTNNTFVNLPSNKEFANNYPNKNNVTFDFKGNIFYNTWRLQKIAGSAVRNFTAADNSIIGITNPVDGTDASSYATIDSLLIIGEKPFVVPTSALDLSKEIDLKANFQPYGLSYAGQMGFGDPRWKAEVYEAGLALAEDSLEYIGVRAKRANSWKFQGVGETFDIKVTTGNKAMPVVYASSNEAVVTVTPEGLATAVAPGSAIITMSQEPTAEFKAATLEMNVQVLPKAEYKKMYADAEMEYKGINLSDVLAPVVVGGKTFYQISDSVASYVGYFDPTAPAQVQTSNRKMFIDYLTDEAIEDGAAVASTDGTVTVAPIAGALNTHTNPNMPKQMYFLVSNTKAAKFYYTGSSGSGSTVTLWVINAAGDTIATVEGGAAAGKGTTSNVLTYTMPDKGNYKLAVWGTSGDMEVYYAKFFCEAKPEPITEPRKWDFSNIKNDYADEYAAIWHSPDYWSDGGTRASNVVAFDGEELTVDGATKIGFTEGLFWTAAAGKLLIGDGSSKNYQCIQTQKGVKFYIPQVAAGDTIKFVGCAPSKAGTFTFENAEPATIDVSKGSSYTEFVVVMTADGEFVYNAPQDIRLQSIAVIPATGTPTGINDISTKNAKFFGEGIYDLNGRKVLNPVKGNIYIVNGKKYIAR